MPAPRTPTFALLAATAALVAAVWFAAGHRERRPLPAATSPPRALAADGVPREARLTAGEVHAYTVELAAGDFLHAVVEQRGIDVVVALHDPRDRLLLEVDGPSGASGMEEVFAVASRRGRHRLVVRPYGDAGAGTYSAWIAALRPAAPDDRLRAEAAGAFARGEALRARDDARSLRRAVALYEEALAGWHVLGERPREALARRRLGQSRFALGELQAAADAYEAALRVYREIGSREDELRLLNDTGAAYRLLGAPARAAACYRRALVLADAAGHRPGEVTALNNLGVLYHSLGATDEAVEYYYRALEGWRALGDRAGEAGTLHNLGETYSLVGRTDEALDVLGQALAIRRAGGDRRGEAATLTAIGWAQALGGDLAAAIASYDRAIHLRRSLGDRAGEAGTLDRRATAHRSMGQRELARDAYEDALRICRQLGDRPGEAHTLANLGGLHQEGGEPRRALAAFARAIALFRDFGDRNGEVHSLVGSARAEIARGRLDVARQRLEEALEILRSLHGAFELQALSASYLASRYDYWETYVDLLMRLDRREPGQGHDVRALEAAEEARARTLLDALKTVRSLLDDGTEAEVEVRRSRLQARLNDRERRRSELLAAGASEADLAPLEGEIRTLLLEVDRLRAAARRRPEQASRPLPRPLRLAEIRSQVLDEESLLLYYALGAERSYLWVVAGDSLTSHLLPGREEIETRARQVHELLAKSHQRGVREQAHLAARDLSEIVLGPAAAELGGKRLLVAADGALHAVPFAALPAPGATDGGGGDEAFAGRGWRPLLADHEVINVPSASVVAALRRRAAGRRPAAGALAVVADPVFGPQDPRLGDGASAAAPASAHERPARDLERSAEELGVAGFTRLAFSRREAEAILALVPRQEAFGALGLAASRDTVVSGDLSGYRILHFATHALLHPSHPELSGLVLSLVDERGRPRDGFLRAHEIRDLVLPADLVVLSACRTAVGPEVRGEGPLSLARSFLDAGAARAIVTLWSVNDEASAELMRRFYRGVLADRLRPPEALRAAQLSMAGEERWQAAYYWAPYVFLGEWR